MFENYGEESPFPSQFAALLRRGVEAARSLTMSEKKTDPGIKPLGQALQQFNELYVLVRDVLAKHAVSALDLAAWLVGAGRTAFVVEFLEPLLKRFRETQRVRTVNKTTILVNLDADPFLPFAGAKIVANAKGGLVKVQLRRDGHLYANEKRVDFYLSEKQKFGSHRGYDLKDELIDKRIPVLHPNIMDALIDHAPHLIPEELKADENGAIWYMFWWTVVYENADGDQCVRYCCFGGGAWRRGCHWLGGDFDRRSPAARAS